MVAFSPRSWLCKRTVQPPRLVAAAAAAVLPDRMARKRTSAASSTGLAADAVSALKLNVLPMARLPPAGGISMLPGRGTMADVAGKLAVVVAQKNAATRRRITTAVSSYARVTVRVWDTIPPALLWLML